MSEKGYFEEIYHFNETPIFDKVTVSIVIFKFVKSAQKVEKIKVAKFYANQKLRSETLGNLKNQVLLKDAEYLQVSQFKLNERWLLQSDEVRKELQLLEKVCKKPKPTSLLSFFDEEKIEFHTIGEICDIGNGLVSGLDKAFQVNGHELNSTEKNATINVVKAKDLTPFFVKKITSYIFINDGLEENEFQKTYPNYYLHFQKYKADLEKRYQYNRKINYWEWAFLRNFNLFNTTDKRIFVPCKERISNKDYFRFALVEGGVFPTQDVTAIFRKPETKESIEYILAYLNQPIIFDWLKCNGIVKGNIVEFSEKPIASIPFRKINWNNENEVLLHNSITDFTHEFLTNKDEKLLAKINSQFNQLFESLK
jgi:adenine-specific DNA-methyltransferase